MFLSDSQQCVVAAGHVAANLTDWKSILVDHKAGLVLGFFKSVLKSFLRIEVLKSLGFRMSRDGYKVL